MEVKKEVKQTLAAAVEMSEQEYRVFRDFLEKSCGIVLGDNKQYLVTSRMRSVMADYKLGSLRQLIENMQNGCAKTLRNDIIEAMTTNETSWFRDSQPYTVLKENILPEIARAKKDRLRFWSAACSSGQEPYSIAMAIHEYQLGNPGVMANDYEIMATDISPGMLKQAEHAVYDDANVARGLSQERKKRYFQRHEQGWCVAPVVRSKVTLREFNLLENYALLGRFDVVFCRNVLIYFSKESKKDILERIAKILNPDGYVFLGGSESMTNVTDKFTMEKINGCVVYRVKP